MSQTNIPIFDSRRWGPGVLVLLAAFFAVGVGGFVEGSYRQSAGLLIVGGVCLLGGITVLVVKLGEEINPKAAKWSVVGETGEVVKPVGPRSKGVVRVGSELWSGMSDSSLGPGTGVRAVRVEGLVVWVEELP